MTKKPVPVIENGYFSARLAHGGGSGPAYWDLMRKEPLLSGAAPELLEIAAGILAGAQFDHHLLIPVNDHVLFRDLQVMGCEWIGYALALIGDGGRWELWGPSYPLQVVPVRDIETAFADGKPRVERLVLKIGTELAHDPRWGVKGYLDFVRSRERYFTGLSGTDYLQSRTLWEPHVDAKTGSSPVIALSDSAERSVTDFQNVLSKRVSSTTFLKTVPPAKSELNSVFQDAYFLRADGHFPVATAGALGSLCIHVVTQAGEQLNAGCYGVDSMSREWVLKSSGPSVADIHCAGFSQPVFKHCASWLIIEADLGPLASKYGNRAYRFALMGVGALMQTLHLSCVSHGIQFRALGGFDDGILEKLLEISPGSDRRPLAVAGMGK